MVSGRYSATQRSAGKKVDGAWSRNVRRSAKNELWDLLVNNTIKLSLIEQHDMVHQGISMTQLNKVLGCFSHLTQEEILLVLGVSKRTVQNRKTGVLGPEPFGALLDLIAVVQKAADVLGDREAAETWMMQRAIALDGLRPVELLSTRQGAKLVKDHLKRMEYGLYA